MLHAELIHALTVDGVVTLNTYLNEDAISSMLTGLGKMQTPADATSLRVRRGVAFARRNLLDSPQVREFIASDAVETLITSFDVKLIAVRAILFDKTGDANWTVPWHQDRSIAVARRIDTPGFGPWSEKAGVVHVQPPVEVLRSMLTLRFSLDPCDADNGPLRAIPGTHESILAGSSIEHVVATRPHRTCLTEAGGVVIMRPLTLHASSPATIARHRRVLHIEFGLPMLAGGLAWAFAADEFVSSKGG